MKKKNLIILLLIPFVITLVGVITINTTFNFIENDLIGIDWSYDEIEGIKLEDKPHKLVASPIYEQGYAPLKEEALVWSVYDSDNPEGNKYAKIVNENDAEILSKIKFDEPNTVSVPILISRLQAGAGLVNVGSVVDIYTNIFFIIKRFE